jgi:hypothetical protein
LGFQPYAPASLYPQKDSWYSFLLEAEAGRIRLIEISTSSGLDPATFRLVAKCPKVPERTQIEVVLKQEHERYVKEEHRVKIV